jgi:hypothetical protein
MSELVTRGQQMVEAARNKNASRRSDEGQAALSCVKATAKNKTGK